MSDKILDSRVPKNRYFTYIQGPQEEISKLNEQMDDIGKQARFDLLTKLQRREELIKRLKEKPYSDTSLLFIDLDNLKGVNDVQGDHCGDEVLQIFGERLRGKFTKTDIYRKGGDEFIVLLEGVVDKNRAKERAEQFREYIEENPIVVKDLRQFQMTVSIGIAMGKDFTDPDEYIKVAGIKMHDAKRTGRNKVVV